jgi:hypothetical protein
MRREYRGYQDWIIYLAVQLALGREHLGDAWLATTWELKDAREFLNSIGVKVPREA